MERDGLMAEHVVAGRDVGWDLHGPGVVVGDHVIVCEIGRPSSYGQDIMRCDDCQSRLADAGLCCQPPVR